jgi:hypothetical protein
MVCDVFCNGFGLYLYEHHLVAVFERDVNFRAYLVFSSLMIVLGNIFANSKPSARNLVMRLDITMRSIISPCLSPSFDSRLFRGHYGGVFHCVFHSTLPVFLFAVGFSPTPWGG